MAVNDGKRHRVSRTQGGFRVETEAGLRRRREVLDTELSTLGGPRPTANGGRGERERKKRLRKLRKRAQRRNRR